ncbi:uncharacterized protein LOC111776840 [Cucurbita pepo subsp. pepo]|uniref:uncharacterized protein LOC111776840 n=1 Tax=Cucurbita pepo subsp. pepo TaxID=3664 RepID=UPI000C9D3241|nr:uncharacterized protein LOC111776840 [Cucurbita pepo subsp. pepo]
MLHLHSPTFPSFLFPLLTCPLIGSFHILHAPPSSMAFSPFLSGVTHSSADLAGVDFDWLPDSSIKLWNSEVSDSCGDGSPTSPPQPLTFRRPTNRFLLDQSFSLLNPSLQTTSSLHRTFSSSSSSPPPPTAESLPSRPLFPAGDFKEWGWQRNKQRAESPVSCESSITIEGLSRACRYSPEEKKERIERYKSKRNQRNFNKKIKYACRKSLADSRPRIRGRFARYNDNPAKNCPMQWSHEQKEEEEEEANNGGENWIKYFIDAYSSANLIP